MGRKSRIFKILSRGTVIYCKSGSRIPVGEDDTNPRVGRPTTTTSGTAQPSSPSLARSSESSELESRSSTPATDAPSRLASPPFEPPPPTAETLRRRQQSDAAAAEIGSRLLKGWAMLADECPNPNCFGIPLVRPPQLGDERSSKRECVTCGTVYTDDGHGLVAVNMSSNELLDVAAPILVATDSKLRSEGQLPARNHSMRSSTRQRDMGLSSADVGSQVQGRYASLDSASASLELTMRSLSKRLAVQSSNSDGMDVMAIGGTVDVLGKVLNVMERIENLRSSS